MCKVNKRRRSLLYVPSCSEKMISKAKSLTNADAVILDLEDSVASASKETAREMACGLLKEKHPNDGREWIVRINGLDSVWAFDDLSAVMYNVPDAIIVPKATWVTIVHVDGILSMLERKHMLPTNKTPVLPLIETALGIMELDKILAIGNRITGIIFGAEDYTRDMEISRTDSGSEIAWCRNRLAVACKAAGVDCIDTPYANFKDTDGYKSDTYYAKSIGMTGRTLIHPSQIDITNQIFTPSENEITYAKRIVAAFHDANSEGAGAVALDGNMIDLPVYDRAKRLLDKIQ